MHGNAGGSPITKIDLYLLLGVAVFLFLLLFRIPIYPFFHESDQLIFLYNADRMIAGEAMYRDFFQFTFPGGHVLYYVLFTIFGTHYSLLPLAIIAMGTASFYFLLRVSQRAIGSYLAYLPPVIFVFFGMRWFGLDGSHRMFSPLLVLIATYVLLRGRGLFHLAAAGSLCALASYFTQQRGMVAVASLVIFVLIEVFFTGRQWKRPIQKLTVLGGSFIATLYLLCLPFIVSAGWEPFFWSTIEYPATYYRYHEQNSVSGLTAGFRDLLAYPGSGKFVAFGSAIFYTAVVPLAPLCLFILFAVKRRDLDWEYWRTPMLLAILGAFAVLGTPNPGHLRYYQIAAPSLVLTFWLVRHFDLLRGGEGITVKLICAALVILGTFQAFRLQSSEDLIVIDAPRGRVYAAANGQIGRYVWIGERASQGDAVFETTNPYIYFLFGLRNPSRYTQILPTDYTRPEFVRGTVEDLSKDPPKFILWPNNYIKPAAERASGDHTAPLADFVREYYAPVGPVYNVDNQQIQIWERKTAERSPK